MGIHFVWVTGLQCVRGHDLSPQSKARMDYCGYPTNAVPLEVAEDLRDNPFDCPVCTYRETPMGDKKYRLRFVGEPRSVCEGCGKESACRCYKVVAVELWVTCEHGGSNKPCRICQCPSKSKHGTEIQCRDCGWG